MDKILVLGVGNILFGDEGAGVHAINRLKAKGLPENVEVLDGGTIGTELLFLLDDVSKMIILDCLDTGAEPGSIFRFRPEDIRIEDEVKMSFHDLGLMEVLNLAKTCGKLPETVIYGIQPAIINNWDLSLSPAVEGSLSGLVDLVIKEIGMVI